MENLFFSLGQETFPIVEKELFLSWRWWRSSSSREGDGEAHFLGGNKDALLSMKEMKNGVGMKSLFCGGKIFVHYHGR